MSKKPLVAIWPEFLGMFHASPKTADAYYRAIVAWLEEHRAQIGEEALSANDVVPLMALDPAEHVLAQPDLDVHLEAERMRRLRPETIDTAIMVIRDTLLAMLLTYADAACPWCGGHLAYWMTAVSPAVLFTRCTSCTFEGASDGATLAVPMGTLVPATPEVIREHDRQQEQQN